MSTTVALTIEITLDGGPPQSSDLQAVADDMESVALDHLQTPLGEIVSAQASVAWHWHDAPPHPTPRLDRRISEIPRD